MNKCNIILIITIIFVSCTNQPNKNSNYTQGQIDSLRLDSTKTLLVDASNITEVDLNPLLGKRSFNFEAQVEEIKLIPLETTDESLLSNIYKIVLTDSANYIFDKFKGGSIVIFNKDGKFVKRISHGGGPGELYKPDDVIYDKENNELIVYQHPFLLFYTSTGKFIRQVQLPFGFYNFETTPDGYIFKTLDSYGNEHLGSKKDNTLLITDKKFKLKYASLPVSPININYGGYSYLYRNNTINITQNFTDTIYQYKNGFDKLEAAYVMNYDSKKLPLSYLEGDREVFRQARSNNDYYYYIGEYLETETHHAFFLRNDYIGLQTIVYRDKSSGKMIGGTNVEYNLNEIPTMGFPTTTFGKYFISTHLPNKNDQILINSSIISSEDKQKIKDLKEDDNPVLVLYSLKNI